MAKKLKEQTFENEDENLPCLNSKPASNFLVYAAQRRRFIAHAKKLCVCKQGTSPHRSSIRSL